MKNLFTFFLIVCIVQVHAQIGIGTTSPTSTLDIRGSHALNYRSFTASTTAAVYVPTILFIVKSISNHIHTVLSK